MLALTWITVGESPLSAPPELPAGSDFSADNLPSEPIGSSTSTNPATTRPSGSRNLQPSVTTGNNQTTGRPQQGTNRPTVATTLPPAAPPAGALPSSANKAAAVKLYVDAIAKAKKASGFNAQKVETANMNIHTGERVTMTFPINIDFGMDEFFHNFVSSPRTSNYQYGGGTWSLVSQRTNLSVFSNKQEPQPQAYAEYGTSGSVAYKDSKYWNLSPENSSGVSHASLNAMLWKTDVLKMAKVASPSNFLPPASFSADDVIAYNYNKTGSGATISFTLSASAITRAMIMPDTNAICASPYVYDAGIKVTMTFNALNLQWQNPRIEVTLNAQGLPTSIKQSSALGSNSNGTMSLNSTIKNFDNISSSITGNYSVNWTLSNWGDVGTPGRPF
ncbi:MAG: hypothetical protein LBJ12_07435 [Oscillospiraceae bacterium]|nr:hypothetical protein [Oscillospiraceae bacterium]